MRERPRRSDSLRSDRLAPNVNRPSDRTMQMDQGEPEPTEPLADIFAPDFKYDPAQQPTPDDYLSPTDPLAQRN